MPTIVHVAQDAIRRNMKHGTDDPTIIVRQKGQPTRHHGVELVLDGRVVGTFRYSREKPLSCGARVWLELAEGVDARPL